MKTLKRAAAALLATVLVLGMSMTAAANDNDPIDGNTPENIENRVKTSSGETLWPTVITNYHATELSALIPSSTKAEFDAATGVDVSIYDDACTQVYVANNDEYGYLAAAALENALSAVQAKKGPTFTINLFKYEGKAYKPLEYTTQSLLFTLQIPTSLRASTRDFAVLRLNADGTVAYLTDLDTDPKTVTFSTNYFATYGLYCLAYGGKGCFDAYKPAAITAPVVDPATAVTTTTVTVPQEPIGTIQYVVIGGQYIAVQYVYDANGQLVLVPVQ